MFYELYYEQTPNERYGTDMNDRVRNLIEEYGLRIDEEFGGSMIAADADALVAEAGFVVEATLTDAIRVQEMTQDIIGRPVRLSKFDE